MNVIEKIEANHYVATETQVEQLALAQHTAISMARHGDGTYLRILVAACQAKLGKRRGPRPKADAQLAVLEQVHERFYPAVLRGVTTQDITHEELQDAPEKQRRALERNRRSVFARTSKATLAAFLRGHGDIRSLDVDTVTKGALRSAIGPTEPANKTARQIVRAQDALIRAVRRQARASPDDARDTLETAMAELQKVLDSLDSLDTPDVGATTTLVAAKAHQRTRVGVPVMVHRPQAGT